MPHVNHADLTFQVVAEILGEVEEVLGVEVVEEVAEAVAVVVEEEVVEVAESLKLA